MWILMWLLVPVQCEEEDEEGLEERAVAARDGGRVSATAHGVLDVRAEDEVQAVPEPHDRDGQHLLRRHAAGQRDRRGRLSRLGQAACLSSPSQARTVMRVS